METTAKKGSLEREGKVTVIVTYEGGLNVEIVSSNFFSTL